jgi:hypothetical protein
MRGAAFVLALLLAAAPAASDDDGRLLPFKINGTNTFLVRYFDKDFLQRFPGQPQDKWELYNRLVLNLSRGPVLVGLQFDLDRFDLREGRQSLEKRYVEYRRRGLTATAGDFFASFGRGTALSVIKTHELYGIENQIDNTIDGGRFLYSGKTWRAEALAGRVHDKLRDADDTLYGGSASYRPARWLRAGGSLVRGELEEENLDADLASLHVELARLAGAADVYYEYTTLRSSRPFSNGAEEGRAAYLSATAAIGDLSFTAEYKDLENFFFRYSTPPIIEDQGMELISDFFAFYPEDLEAAKLRVDYSLPTETLLYAVVAHYDEKATRHPSYYRYLRDIHHFYFGVEHAFESGAHLLGFIGRRREESTGYFYQFTGPTTHGAVEGTLPLWSRFSVEVEYRFSRLNGDLVEFERNKLAVSLARSQLFTLTGVWESSNLPGEIFYTGKEDFYYAQLDIKILRKHLVRIFAGETRGGMKCSGGVCKYVPAFSGTRFEAVIRF